MHIVEGLMPISVCWLQSYKLFFTPHAFSLKSLSFLCFLDSFTYICKMKLIKNKEVGGERPLFGLHDTRLENITITDGESGIKQCQHMEAANCRFYGKYPW